MTPLETVLGGVVIALLSSLIGGRIGANGKMTSKHCEEKQTACSKLILEKIKNIEQKLDNLTKLINNKIFGI